MIHVIDASEGPYDSGRYPEASLLAARADGSADELLGLGPASGVLAGLTPLERSTTTHLPLGPLPQRQRLYDRAIEAWGRRPARWALRQDPSTDLSLHLLESPRRATARTRRLARMLGKFRRITVRDEADARAWLACGLPGARLNYLPAQAAPPPGPSDRASLREALAVEDDEFLVMPIGAPWSAVDAQRLIFLLGLLRIDGVRATGLLPASAWRLAAGRHFGKVAGTGARVIVIDGAMTPWLAACDAAFLDAARPRDRLASFVPRGALRVLIAATKHAGVPLAVAPGSLLEPDATPAPSVAAELRLLSTLGRAFPAGQPARHAVVA